MGLTQLMLFLITFEPQPTEGTSYEVLLDDFIRANASTNESLCMQQETSRNRGNLITSEPRSSRKDQEAREDTNHLCLTNTDELDLEKQGKQ